MSILPAVRAAIAEGARDHGVYEVDYLSALVAADRGRAIPGVPALNESLLKGAVAS